MIDPQPVEQIAGDATGNQAERDLSAQPVGLKVMSLPDQSEDGHQGYRSEEPIIPVKHAPRRARVADVDDVEEVANDFNVTARTVGVQGIKRHVGHDPKLRQLVETEDGQRQRP